MILILAEIQLTTHNNNFNLAKVWVNENNSVTAEALAITLLSEDGCTIQSVIENTTTERNDYFPPCTSLDAFILAEQTGIAVLYT